MNALAGGHPNGDAIEGLRDRNGADHGVAFQRPAHRPRRAALPAGPLAGAKPICYPDTSMGWAAMEGFVYRPEFVGEEEERALLAEIARLEFGPVRMRGVVARRRVLHYGWLYNFASSRISPGPPLPDVLVPLRGRCAELAGVRSEDLAEALVTEYPVGAGIGWHRDAPLFGLIVAVSLAGRCRLRFRRQDQKAEIEAAPRSAYLLSGPARTEWEHHIPPTRELRYSITYRTLRRRTA